MTTAGPNNDTRLSVLERDVLYVQRALDNHMVEERELHKAFNQAVSKLDERTDQIAARTTAAFTVVAVLWALIILLAPFLRDLLGLTGS